MEFHTRKKNIQTQTNLAVAKEGLQSVPAGGEHFTSIIEGASFWLENYQVFFFQA